MAISHSRRGAGEPVVLIHGIGHHRRAWEPFASLLAEHYDVTVVDLPGHGESPGPTPPYGYSIASHSEQFEALFAELGIDRPHVIGNSLGGRMALDLAARGSVRSALALSPASFWGPAGLAWAGVSLLSMRAATQAPAVLVAAVGKGPARRRLLMRNLYAHPERLTHEDFVADSLNLRRSVGFWHHLALVSSMRPPREIAVPTTIAWGEHDRLLVPTQARKARRLLPDVQHVALPGCGHVPMLDDPELLLRVARETFVRASLPAADVAPDTQPA